MRKIVLTLTAAVLMTAFALPAQAQLAQRWEGVLDLSEEQVTQLQELYQQHQQELASERAELIKAQAELRALRLAPERDISALEQAIKKVSDLRTGLQVQALKNREESLTVLTEDQRDRLQTMRAVGQARALGGRAGLSVRGSRGAPGRGVYGPGMRGRVLPGRGMGVAGRGMQRLPGARGFGFQPGMNQGFRSGPGRGICPPGTGRGLVPPPPPEK